MGKRFAHKASWEFLLVFRICADYSAAHLSFWCRFTKPGKDLADRTVEYRVGNLVELRRLSIQDDHSRARGLRVGNCTGNGVDLQARSNREQEVGLLHGRQGALDHFRHKSL